MKKRYLIIPAFTLITLATTSCGLGLKEIYRGDEYNSPVFEENYYTKWDSRIDANNINNKIIKTEVINLDKTQDYVFESYYKRQDDGNLVKGEPDQNLLSIDSAVKNLRYSPWDVINTDKELYGDVYKLSNQNDSFKHGVLSKLYDGQLYCEGNYQLARVQINENGFGTILNNQGSNLDYFAVQFKSSNDYTNYDDEEHLSLVHFTDILLKISFYVKKDDKYEKYTYQYQMNHLYSNYQEDLRIYNLFGFKINKNKITNVQGYSIEYEVINDEYASERQHSLMLYEVMFPHSTWH
jgi:hypothetical protein